MRFWFAFCSHYTASYIVFKPTQVSFNRSPSLACIPYLEDPLFYTFARRLLNLKIIHDGTLQSFLRMCSV